MFVNHKTEIIDGRWTAIPGFGSNSCILESFASIEAFQLIAHCRKHLSNQSLIFVDYWFVRAEIVYNGYCLNNAVSKRLADLLRKSWG